LCSVNSRKPRPSDAPGAPKPKPAAKRPAARGERPDSEGSGDAPRRASARPSNRSFDRAPREDRPYGDRPPRADRPYGDRPPRADRPFGDRPPRADRPYGDRPARPSQPGGAFKTFGPKKEFRSNDARGARPSRPSRPTNPPTSQPTDGTQAPYEPWNMEGLGPKHFSGEGRIHPKYGTDGRERKAGYANTGYRKQPTGRPKFKTAEEYAPDSDTMRLNRYLAHAGISSRREADELISQGLVTVNGQVVTEMGYKVQPGDDVRYAGERLKSERKVYVLLNKPKGFITTVDDERARKTVMDLVANACRERIYPVGRLDRATTGVLLLTNDGAMAKKLTHPSHGARKIYHVTLDKPFSPADADRLKRGIKLDDGPVQVDQVEIPDPENLYEVGVEIHVGRNRIVRRMFGALGYEVVKLDRTVFAGLTKKNLSRGQYRLLNEKEIAFLKIQQ
ncbi:MAG: pseudouridine synthase, partial [Schleiferiaceae bacterium]